MKRSLSMHARIFAPFLAVLLVMTLLVTPRVSNAAGPSNCTECNYGCGVLSTSHTAPITAEGPLGSVHTNCIDIGEACAHPPCSAALQTFDLQQALILAGTDGALDLETARSLLNEYPGSLKFNAARGALQIVGCSPGTVIAHIPVSEAAAGTLAAEAPTSIPEGAHS